MSAIKGHTPPAHKPSRQNARFEATDSELYVTVGSKTLNEKIRDDSDLLFYARTVLVGRSIVSRLKPTLGSILKYPCDSLPLTKTVSMIPPTWYGFE